MVLYSKACRNYDAAENRGEESEEYEWGILNPPWQGFEKKTFTKIEAYAGMTERLVRDFVIEEALQDEIKDTI